MKYASIAHYAHCTGPTCPDDFTADDESGSRTLDVLANYPVLVIGAGGLGCELLKNLALSGFKNIEVIDLDTIDVSNLNRQFLFRQSDVGRPKAVVAAEFIRRRFPDVTVTAHHARIQEFEPSYYARFKMVIAGLDNVDARRWINATLCNLVELDADGDIADPDSIVFLVDGGTEGFKGHARVIIPRLTGCFECGLALFPPPLVFAQCTIVNTPRNAAHCIAYAQHMWEAGERGGSEPLDKDNAEHMQWIVRVATQHAAKFHIADTITLQKAKGVIGNIIPAIASTNAVVAAVQVSEAVKIATGFADAIDNYLMYNGGDGAYGMVFSFDKEPSCAVCGSARSTMQVPHNETVEHFLERLEEHPQYQLKRPSVKVVGGEAVWIASDAFREQFEPNLARTMGEFVGNGDVLIVSDPSLMVHIELTVLMNSETVDSAGSGSSSGSRKRERLSEQRETDDVQSSSRRKSGKAAKK